MSMNIAEQYAEELTLKSRRKISESILNGDKYAEHAKPYTYTVQHGKKYDRIVQHNGYSGGGSVHAFVEQSTGKLIKAAGWVAPAKDKNGLAYRYDLSTLEGFRLALHNADDYGRYLYADYMVIVLPTDDHGNSVARMGWDRCMCGSKYWENDKCVDCDTHVEHLPLEEMLVAA